jgi:hypothetical protein
VLGKVADMQTEPATDPTDADAREAREQSEISAVVKRLSRRQASGCEVIERAAILAEGTRSGAILAWITSHSWEPEEPPPGPTPARAHRGLHSERTRADDRAPSRPPQRYVRRPTEEPTPGGA